VFDGNIESLPGRFSYLEEKNRAIAVHPAAIIETLRKLYGAGSLADEIEGAAAAPPPAEEDAVKKMKSPSNKKR